MSINQDQMLQAIYDTLFSAFTSPPTQAKGQGASQADQTYLTLEWPGLQIDVEQFANPWSPQNPNGSTTATENLSFLVDKVQSLNPIYSANGQNVSDIYNLVVNAQVVPPPLDPKAQQDYNEATAFLQADGTDFDDLGKPITVKVDSSVYAAYKRKKKAYDNAVVSMMSNYFQYDISKPEDQRKWALLGSTFIDSVNTAWDDWTNAQKTKVEEKLAVLAQSSNNQVGVVFNAAKAQLNNLRKASLTETGKIYWASYASPSNWFASSAAKEWQEVTIDSKSLRVSEHSDYSKMSAGGSASWGLWSVGGSFSKEDSHQSMDKTTTALTVSFKFARVDITRPWLNFLLFNIKGWKTEGYSASEISNGTKTQPLKTPFPNLPTSFIALRDLKITANWGHEDSSFIKSKLSTKASVGWGPFAVSGAYSQGSEDKKFNSDFDGRTISNDGLQIIGWVNTIVPACPPA
ncbi:MAG: hypothetical protein V7L29_30070 [Nostoc sp.]|uniref:hypothetical protein n=1 Tax=Nostoc sp. TaxID=1180 RepID=UPI002FFCA56E